MKMKNLAKMLLENNPSELQIDQNGLQIVQIPENIPQKIETSSKNSKLGNFYLKMNPKYDYGDFSNSLAGLNLINTDQKSACNFISDKDFQIGTHFFEISHFSYFDHISIGLVNSENIETEIKINKIIDSVIFKIDLDNLVVKIYQKGEKEINSLKLEKGVYRLFIKIQNIGNFVSFNPFYAPKNFNSVWSLNLNQSVFGLKEIDGKIFFMDLDDEQKKMIKDNKFEIRMKENKDVEKGIQFDEHLNVGFFLARDRIFDDLKNSNPKINMISGDSVKLLLKTKNSNFYKFLKKNLDLKHKNKIEKLKKTIEKSKKNFNSNSFEKIKKSIYKSNPLRTVYSIPKNDRLLITNNTNKIKLISEKNTKGEFIINPFIFMDDKVTFYLTKEEHNLFFNFFNYNNFFEKILLDEDQILSLNNFFQNFQNKENILSDENYVYYKFEAKNLQSFIQAFFDYINCLIKNTQIKVNEKDISNKNFVSEGENETELVNLTNDSSDQDNYSGIALLFQENNKEDEKIIKNEKLNKEIQSLFTSNYENFPKEFDSLLTILFKIEESLFLQNENYRSNLVFTSRNHSSFNRLFSFLNCKGTTCCPIEKLIDFGIYCSSSFLSEFKHYQEDLAYENFCDFNGNKISKFNFDFKNFDYSNISLGYCLNQLPAVFVSSEIENVFLLRGDMLSILTKKKEILIFSTKYGLVQLSKLDLLKSSPWDHKDLFENLVDKDINSSNLMKLEDVITNKKVEDKKKSVKTKDIINPEMLDKLYNMGFSLKMAKKALSKTKSESLSAAINIIFDLKNEEQEELEKKKPQVPNLIIKPEWNCSLCTYINISKNLKIPDQCEICGNIETNAYVELNTDTPLIKTEKIDTKKKENNNNKNTLLKSDIIINCLLVRYEKENLLNSNVLVVFFKRNEIDNILFLRLAYNKNILNSLTVVNKNSGNICSLIGQKYIKKNFEERDLGEFINDDINDQFFNILPHIIDEEFLVESDRLVFECPQNFKIINLFASEKSLVFSRKNESIPFYLYILNKECKSHQFLNYNLVNESKKYSDYENTFTFKKIKVKHLDKMEVHQFLRFDNNIVYVEKNNVYRMNLKDFNIKEILKGDVVIKDLLKMDERNLMILKDDKSHQLLILEESEDQLQNKKVEKLLGNIITEKYSKKNKDDWINNPKAILNSFNVQKLLKYKYENSKNLYFKNLSSYNFSNFIQPIKKSEKSSLDIILKNKKEVLNVDLNLFLKLDKKKKLAKKLLTPINLENTLECNKTLNNWTDLPLRYVSKVSNHFSKSVKVSNILKNDPLYYVKKDPFEIYVFESIYEKYMKLSKFKLKISENDLKKVNKFLIFVFNDLSQANFFEKYKYLSPSEYSYMKKNNLFPENYNPVYYLDTNKFNGPKNKFDIEFNTKINGKYIAFLPIQEKNKKSVGLVSFEYFGVEGEYSCEKDLLENCVNSKEHRSRFEAINLKGVFFKNNEKDIFCESFKILSFLERENDVIFRASANLNISECGDIINFNLNSDFGDFELLGADFKIYSVFNKALVEMRNQFKNKDFSKISEIISVLRKNLLSDCESSVKLDILELFNYFIDLHGDDISNCFFDNLDFKDIIVYLLKETQTELLKNFKIFLEKVLTFQKQNNLKDILIEILKKITNYKISCEGLSLFWQLTFNLVLNQKNLKSNSLKNVTEFLTILSQNLQNLSDKNIKMLKAFNFNKSPTSIFEFTHNEKEDKKNIEINSNNINKNPSEKDFLTFNNFIITLDNHKEIYINTTDLHLIDCIAFKIKDLKKIFDFNLKISVFDCFEKKFICLRNKQFDKNFTNQIVNKTYKDFPFDFSMNLSGFKNFGKLYKIEIDFNHFSNFKYVDLKNIEFEFSLYGVKIIYDKMEKENKIIFENIVKLSNQAYVKNNGEFNKSISPKPVFSSNMKQGEKKTDLNLNSQNKKKLSEEEVLKITNNLNKIQKEIISERDIYLEYMNNLSLMDLKDKSKIKLNIDDKMKIFTSNQKILNKNQNLLKIENFGFGSNISYWNLHLELFTNELQNYKDSENLKKLFINLENLSQFLFEVIYNSYIFGIKNISNLENFIIQLKKDLDEQQINDLKNKLLERFLLEDELIFVSSKENFVKCLFNLGLMKNSTWKETLDQLENIFVDFDKNPENNIKKVLLYSYILNTKKIDVNEASPIESEDIQAMFNYLIWILGEKFYEIDDIFKNLVDIILNLIFSEINKINSKYDIGKEFENLILLLCQNNFLDELSKNLDNYKIGFITSKKQKKVNIPRVLKNFGKIRKAFFFLVKTEIIEEDCELNTTNENLLIFCLKYLQDLEEISYKEEKEDIKTNKIDRLESLKKENSMQRTQSNILKNGYFNKGDGLANSFVLEVITFLNQKNINNEKILNVLIDFVIKENLNQKIFFAFLKFLMTRENDLTKSLIPHLIDKFQKVTLKFNKSKKSEIIWKDFGSLMIDGAAFLLKNYLSVLKSENLIMNFCSYLLTKIINKYTNSLISIESCKVPIRLNAYSSLFLEATKILNNEFNLGDIKNFRNFPAEKIPLFSTMSLSFHILFYSVDENNNFLRTFFVNNFNNFKKNFGEKKVENAIENLCLWMLCNYNEKNDSPKSIIGGKFKKCHSDILNLFYVLFEKEEIAKEIIIYISKHLENLHNVLNEKIKNNQIGWIGNEIMKNAVTFFSLILEKVVSNKETARIFIHKNKGLELIFKILNTNQNTLQKNQVDKKSIKSLIDKLRYLSSSSSITKKNLESEKKKLTPIDFKEQIKYYSVDEGITNGSGMSNWSNNKNGRSSTIYNTPIQLHKKHIKLGFSLPSPIELREISIGITVARSENYIVTGPPRFISLYAIDKKKNKPIYIGDMELIKDPGYTFFNTEVYSLNPNRLNGKNYVDSFNKLKYVKDIEKFIFVVGKPLFTLMDDISPTTNKSFNAVNFSINFININGYISSSVDFKKDFDNIIQEKFYGFIDIIFNSENLANIVDEYFDELNKNKSMELFNMIENQLDQIINVFNVKMSRFLLIISEKNKKMSNIVFRFLMRNIEKNKIFYKLIEKILKKTFSYKFLNEFFEFGQKKLINENSFGSEFLSVISNYLVYLANKLEKLEDNKFILNINKKLFEIVLKKYKSSHLDYNFERFILITLYYLEKKRLFVDFNPELLETNDYKIKNSDLKKDNKENFVNYLNLLFNKVLEDKDYQYLNLIAYSSLKINLAKSKLVEEKMFDLAQKNLKDKKNVIEVLLFLKASCEYNDLHKIIIDKKIDIILLSYLESSIKNNLLQDNISKRNLLLKTIFDVFIKKKNGIEELEVKIFELLKKNYKNSSFIENILMKLFEFEKTRKVQFLQCSKFTQIESSDKIKEISNKPSDSKDLFESSSIMKKEWKTLLQKNLPKLIDEKTRKNFQKYKWKKIISSSIENPSTEKIKKHLFDKKPFLIFLECDIQNQKCVIGIFSPQGFIKKTKIEEGENDAYVPNSDNTFIFFYSNDKTIAHYKPDQKLCENFLEFNTHPDYENLIFSYDNQEKIFICMLDGSHTIDLYPMKPMQTDPVPDYEFPYDVHMNTIEVFQLDIIDDSNSKGGVFHSIDVCTTLNKDSRNNPFLSYFYQDPIYDLQEELTVNQIQKTLGINILNCKEMDCKLFERKEDVIEFKIEGNILDIKLNTFKENYNPIFPIFEVFLQKGGMNYIIETTLKADIAFLKEEQRKKWKIILKNILELQDLEGFLSSMIQQKEFLKIIFELFTGSKTSSADWNENEILVSSLIFNKLGSILSNTKSYKTRISFLKKNVLSKLLVKLQSLTHENIRKYDDSIPKEIKEEVKIIKKEDDEDLVKEIKKRKGVGYDKEGSGKKWLVKEYFEKRKIRNEFIVHLLKLFNNLMDIEYPESLELNIVTLRKSFFNTICESCLLPLLESSFNCSSLHEMAKEYEVYIQYCEMIKLISKSKDLNNLLKRIPATYKPPQLESILSILNRQEENTRLFQSFSKTSNTDDVKEMDSVRLAKKIVETLDFIKPYYPDFFKTSLKEGEEEISSEELAKIKKMPFNKKYIRSLNEFRFELAEMDLKKHHYSSSIKSDSKTSSGARMVRLAQEIADLSSSLPIDSYNAIFVRSHLERLDVMKSIIAGAEGTPYANGLFEYHVFLPSDYPNSPPKCNLETTGNGDVRFNPNLYSCGKVCLSLLGTWRGSASENWDPKISNLLQLFLSIQAVVMSEEVYFNEPGYEGEAGTEEGEKKNEGYSNIVRLCNIKYAMIKKIKTPIQGFEEVIHRHFYLKRDVIMKECKKWIKMAVVRPCTYSGLVSDHNYKYCNKFNADKEAYLKSLKEAVVELEDSLKGLVQSRTIQSIFISKRTLKKGTKKKSLKNKKEVTVQKDLNKLREKIDITYDEIIKSKEFDASDATVTDRWSRYIGAMGIEAVKKQSKAKVILFGMNSLGLEIAKNIVLSGVNKIMLCDWENLSQKDLLANFYAGKTDIGKNRAEIVSAKLQQLNFYVKVENKKMSLEEKVEENFLNEYDIIVITDNYMPMTKQILELADKLKKKVIIGEQVGVYMRVFSDFGDEFIVNDRDGEKPAECFIKEIDYEKGLLTLFKDSVHDIRSGDSIMIFEVVTNEEDKKNKDLKEINGSIHKIKDFKKKNEIILEKIEGYKRFERNGKIKQLKIPQKMKFKRYSQMTKEDLTDNDLRYHDFEKMNSSEHTRQLFILKEAFELKNKKRLNSYDDKLMIEMMTEEQKKDEEFKKRLKRFVLNSNGEIHPISAFLGGIVAQEIIKGITNKFGPINQLFVSEIEDLLQDKFSDEKIIEEKFELENLHKTKYSGLEFLLGTELVEKIKNSKIFMVGSGAIGCELLKNYAMIGLGCGKTGTITLTDPDSIELSNLSRQFLFREKHIGQPKSLVAAKVVETMNTDYKNKIDAKLEKVHPGTEDIFNDKFFKEQDMCLNALDNIKARIYMDNRCVRNLIPLLESGTLGPKGHVQVFIPNITENYGQVRDASNETDIPICTLKMFPEKALHCMEWAKDRFDYFFGNNPKSFIRVIEEFDKNKNLDSVDFKVIKNALKFLKKRPTSFADCVKLARKYFQKYFSNNIKQLLHVYPLDFKTKEGKMFWTLPKRPPVHINFDLKDKLHKEFTIAFSRLYARIWSLEDEKDFKEFDYGKVTEKIILPSFVPKDSEIENIKKQVEKNDKKDEEKEDEAPVEEDPEELKKKQDEEKKIISDLEAMLKKLDLKDLLKKVKEEIFEKDEDKNGHVDFITSLTNLRAFNYKLEKMDWIQVKLKAGRIVPALATTTASISALQTIEAIKLIKGLDLEKIRSAFINLAIPYMTLSEPGPVIKHKIHKDLEVSVWDQWVFEFNKKKNNKLADLFKFIRDKGIVPVDLFLENKAIFFSAINKYDDFKDKKIEDLVEMEEEDNVYVRVICKLKEEDSKPLENIPVVKLVFKKD